MYKQFFHLKNHQKLFLISCKVVRIFNMLKLSTPQFPVTVKDSGSPQQQDTARVTIIVLRNINAPVFQPTSYEVTIDEGTAVGTNIVQVTARDADNVSFSVVHCLFDI